MATPRERARERTLTEIRALAWQQLDREGIAGLSLRAIARELTIVSSAIYRYVPSRDELITELLIEAYDQLAARASAADAGLEGPRATPRARWLAVAHAMRSWALERPSAWALIYGSPVPGYHAPADRTTEPGTRALLVMMTIAAGSDSTSPPRRAPVEPLASELTAAAAAVGIDADGHTTANALAAWTLVVGTISSEVFGYLGNETFPDPTALADHQFRISADLAGLPVDDA